MSKSFIIENENGMRIDKCLAEMPSGLSRSHIQKLIKEGDIMVNDKPVKANYRLISGDHVTINIPNLKEPDIAAEDIPLDILYEDEDVIVVNKPVGMVVHPAAGHPDGTLVNALLYHCGDSLSGINGKLRPGIVHRIDRDTSGLIIAAKNDAAHLALAAQLEDHSLYREYHAIAVGGFREDAGAVDAPVARHPVDRKKMAVDRVNGKNAVTHWRVLERYSGYTYLQCRLETGRTHQIRVHLASLGHPLLGDTVYGAKKPVPGLAGQCLHAKKLTFIHPRSGEQVTVECPLPGWFEAVRQRLGR